MPEDKNHNVVPFERNRRGVELEIEGYYIEPHGGRIPYSSTVWVSKDLIGEVMPAHPTQGHRTILFLKNGKALNSFTDYKVVISRLESP